MNSPLDNLKGAYEIARSVIMGSKRRGKDQYDPQPVEVSPRNALLVEPVAHFPRQPGGTVVTLADGYALKVKLGSSPATQTQLIGTYTDESQYETIDGRAAVATNNTSEVEFIAAPPSKYKRKVKAVSICNRHSASVAVSLFIDDGTNEWYILDGYVLGSKDTIFITEAGIMVIRGGLVDLTSDVTGILPVPNGGTGIAAGNSGGVPYFSDSTTIASSAALAQNQLVLGGGAGGAPATLGSLGTSTQVLKGNAGGAPSWGSVVLTSDVSGILPVANGGTNISSYTAGDMLYASDASTLAKLAANGTGNNMFLRSVSGGNPSWEQITLSDVTGLGTGGLMYGGGGTGVLLSIGSAGQVLAVNAAGTAPEWQTSVVPKYNYLINGGFDYAQRQTPGTDTTIADATYSADRWKILRENAGLQYSRQDGRAESGLVSRYFGRFTKTTAAGKFAAYQIVEGINTIPLRGRTMTFQITMKADTTRTIRMGVFVMNSSGTMDTVPSLFSSLASAASTDPTKGANIDACTATNVSNTTINSSPGNSAGDCSVTNAWQKFAISVSIPSNAYNIICAVWSDADFPFSAPVGILSVAEAGLFDGAQLVAWLPRLPAEELALCQRYCFVFENSNASDYVCQGLTTSTAAGQAIIEFPVAMRDRPTLTATATEWTGYDGTTLAALDTLAIFTTSSTNVTCDRVLLDVRKTGAGWVSNRPLQVLSNTSAGKRMIFSAEL